jgi:hypothetical protein
VGFQPAQTLEPLNQAPLNSTLQPGDGLKLSDHIRAIFITVVAVLILSPHILLGVGFAVFPFSIFSLQATYSCWKTPPRVVLKVDSRSLF